MDENKVQGENSNNTVELNQPESVASVVEDEVAKNETPDSAKPEIDTEQKTTAEQPASTEPNNVLISPDPPQQDDVKTDLPKDLAINVTKPKKTKKLAMVIVVAIALVIALAIGTMLFINRQKEPTSQSNASSTVYPLGAELSLVEGQVQISTDGNQWQEAKVSDQLKDNSYIRTSQDSRAIIALDDGSAIRLNNNSRAKINKLTTTDVSITNESGEIYTRLVKSDRQFVVMVADESYKSLGTAYLTLNTDSVKGVQVYESKVMVSKAGIEVPEGKYYLSESSGTDQANKVNDLSPDTIRQNAFMVWNYQQDKASDEFKDKLGFLNKLGESVVASPPATPNATNSSKLQLSGSAYDSGVKLSWNLQGADAPKGFKVMKGVNPNPTFGKDEAIYLPGSNESAYSWKVADGKTYHFRVCVYSSEGCTLYSNNITITAPAKKNTESKAVPTGTLSLAHKGGNKFSWSLNGNAPYGYKLVWASGSAPVYPGSDYQYHSSPETKNGNITSKSGTYNVRVCMYNTNGVGDKCLNYSNQITVTIP